MYIYIHTYIYIYIYIYIESCTHNIDVVSVRLCAANSQPRLANIRPLVLKGSWDLVSRVISRL